MQYQQIYTKEFIDKFNHTFGKEILKPTQDIGHHIPIESIAEAVGFKVSYHSSEPIAKSKPNGKIKEITASAHTNYIQMLIEMNPNQKRGRQREIFAQDVGTYLFRKIKPNQKVPHTQAIEFGNEFLMPKPLVQRSMTNVVKAIGLNAEKINQIDYLQVVHTMATDMGVLPSRLENRLKELNLMWNNK